MTDYQRRKIVLEYQKLLNRGKVGRKMALLTIKQKYNKSKSSLYVWAKRFELEIH